MALSISSGVSIPGGNPAAAPRPLVVVTNGDDRADYQAMRAYRRLELTTDIAAPTSSAHEFGDRSA